MAGIRYSFRQDNHSEHELVMELLVFGAGLGLFLNGAYVMAFTLIAMVGIYSTFRNWFSFPNLAEI